MANQFFQIVGFTSNDINGQTEDTTPATGDFVVTYDVSATALKKVKLQNIPNGFTRTTVQRFTSGSGTYTRPSGCLAIRVSMCGGGGGGAGSGTSGGTGGNGGNTTWSTAGGSALATAAGGTGAAYNGGGAGTAGGAVTFAAGPVAVISQTGGSGRASLPNAAGDYGMGGDGGANFFGDHGPGGAAAAAGLAPNSNTGGGGGGGGQNNSAGTSTGPGGGAGASCIFWILSPAASYDYAVGAAGSAGSAGTSGYAGGAGGTGVIIVEEFYN